MSLRASAHTGVAIRVPAEIPGKLVGLRANPQPLSYSPKVLLSAMPCRKENGLSRRFAPRNDMQKVGRCARVQGRNDMQKVGRCARVQGRNDMQKLAGCLRLPGGAARVLPESVLTIADALPSSACHCEPVRTLVWQSASPQGNLASWPYFGQIRSAFRIRPKYYSPLCPAARSTDCHVASLLAMTCRNMAGVSVCKDA